jgi:hypothetical protein
VPAATAAEHGADRPHNRRANTAGSTDLSKTCIELWSRAF